MADEVDKTRNTKHDTRGEQDGQDRISAKPPKTSIDSPRLVQPTEGKTYILADFYSSVDLM